LTQVVEGLSTRPLVQNPILPKKKRKVIYPILEMGLSRVQCMLTICYYNYIEDSFKINLKASDSG
jgi:hypothetical protein